MIPLPRRCAFSTRSQPWHSAQRRSNSACGAYQPLNHSVTLLPACVMDSFSSARYSISLEHIPLPRRLSLSRLASRRAHQYPHQPTVTPTRWYQRIGTRLMNFRKAISMESTAEFKTFKPFNTISTNTAWVVQSHGHPNSTAVRNQLSVVFQKFIGRVGTRFRHSRASGNPGFSLCFPGFRLSRAPARSARITPEWYQRTYGTPC